MMWRRAVATLAVWLLALAGAAGEEMQVRLRGNVADILSITVVSIDGDREASLLENGTIRPLDVTAFVGGQHRMIPASLQIEFSEAFLVDEPLTLILPLQLAACLGSCESRLVRIPDLHTAFSRNEVRRRCGGGGGTAFSQRTETLLFCQAAHRFQLQRGEGGKEMSDVALNGWYRAAFELHSLHQMLGVRFVGRDEDVERRIRLRLSASGQYQQRVGVTPEVFQDERDQLGAAGREALQYIELALARNGSQPALKEWVEDVTHVFLETVTSAYPPSEADFRLLAAVRATAGLPSLDEATASPL